MRVDWIAVDWGTSNLRIWAMNDKGAVLEEKTSVQGTGTISSDGFEAVFMTQAQSWLSDEKITPVVACGMVGSQHGWQETPYINTPVAPLQSNAVQIRTKSTNLDLWIISGVKQENPADVMRGEETQIAGLLAIQANFNGVVCLPGTHSKWAKISNKKIISFQTVCTGEIFALLSQQSTIGYMLGDWSDNVFVDTVKKTQDMPENTLTSLFRIRAEGLIHSSSNGIAKLSAILIGSELSGTRSFWNEHEVTIIGTNELARLYVLAVEACGGKACSLRANSLALEGLKNTYREVFL